MTAHAFTAPPQAGRKAVLGLRPQHIALIAPDPPADARAMVSLAEPMGACVVLWLELGGEAIAAGSESHMPQRRGDTLGVGADMCRIFLFDAASGERL